jgi:hypothetical protein
MCRVDDNGEEVSDRNDGIELTLIFLSRNFGDLDSSFLGMNVGELVTDVKEDRLLTALLTAYPDKSTSCTASVSGSFGRTIVMEDSNGANVG